MTQMRMILASAHKCGEESINEECLVCRSDITLCQGTEPEKAEESTKAATESVPEPEDPLTSDGNMNLVDDYGDHKTSGKQNCRMRMQRRSLRMLKAALLSGNYGNHIIRFDIVCLFLVC